MTSKPGLLSGGRSIRYPILAIAWVPSLILLLVGLGVTVALAAQGRAVRSSTDEFGGSATAAAQFQVGLFTERRVSELYLTDPTMPVAALTPVRAQVDKATTTAMAVFVQLGKKYPELYGPFVAQLTDFRARLPEARQRIANRQATLAEASAFFTDMTGKVETSLNDTAKAQPVAEAAVEQTVSVALVRATDDFLDADSFALASFLGNGLGEQEYALFAQRLGAYRARFDEVLPLLRPQERQALTSLMNGQQWQSLESAHDLALQTAARTPGADATSAPSGRRPSQRTRTADVTNTRPSIPLPVDQWNAASVAVAQGITGVNIAHSTYSAGISGKEADSQVRRSLIIGALLLGLGLAVFLATTWASGRLINRLRRLREQTLLLAHKQLPSIVSRLRNGTPVDVESELKPLRFGHDEIGQVAEAFEDAQRTAVSAAAREAETRAGLRTVFLDIAHRSQAIVYRQLKVLDQAERAQEDPDQLALLFQLDHLATRSRRNAENLIILGGGQPGRQWRNPVPLLDVVRSAISEAEDYVRVGVGQIPRVEIAGALVADLIHLVAELVDNATSFSPPMSRVEVRGNLVGRGLVLEIEDQGLGIEPEQLEELNRMLHEPPDFQVMALADEPRLGLFVVAQLAARHGIRVTLTPSPAYGGTRVVVLLPNTVVASSEETRALGQGTTEDTAAQQRAHEQRALEQRAVELRAAREAGQPQPSGRPTPVARTPLAPVPPLDPDPSPALGAGSARAPVGPVPVGPSAGPVAGSLANGPITPPPLSRGPVAQGPPAQQPMPSGSLPTRPSTPVPPGPVASGPVASGPVGSGLPVRPASVPPGQAAPAPLSPAPSGPLTPPPVRSSPSVTPSTPVARHAQPEPVRAFDFDDPRGPVARPAPQRPQPDHVIVLPPDDPSTTPLRPSAVPAAGAGRPTAAPRPSGDRAPSAAVPPSAPPGKPALPRRSPQTHLSPRLISDTAPAAPEPRRTPDLPDAELARSRMSALQRGTMRGRATDPEAPR